MYRFKKNYCYVKNVNFQICVILKSAKLNFQFRSLLRMCIALVVSLRRPRYRMQKTPLTSMDFGRKGRAKGR